MGEVRDTDLVAPHMREDDDEVGEAHDVSDATTSTNGGQGDQPDAESSGGQPPQSGAGFKGSLQEILKETLKGRPKPVVGAVDIHPDIGAHNIEYSKWTKDGPGLRSRAQMTEEGKINIWVDLKRSASELDPVYTAGLTEYATDPKGTVPKLNIVIFIVGSRGDVQPYLSLALRMIKQHGHRVRIATHPDFENLVLGCNRRLKDVKGPHGEEIDGNLEFFSIGGDPKALMAYMVKNPGLLPGWETLKSGDVQAKRRMTGEMLQGVFRSIFSPDQLTQRPFAADAIISNPPAFAHCHLAEAFGLPLHMTFTMPWSASRSFTHPLVNIQQTNAGAGLTNLLTFSFADMMTWQGLGDVINAFRGLSLGLEPLSARSGPSVLDRLGVPWTYCWSEGLIPKPDDWKEHIDISGFYFLNGKADYKPDDDLADFLKKGDPPIYIGFGSVVVDDPGSMTSLIFEAVRAAGVRALVSAGWGGLGGTDIPDDVFILEGNIPHDWLFSDGRVSAVCHHGGAGTTAIGLRNGLPTIVVPFFGDQKFWGDMVNRAGAGPVPIPQKQLSAENLTAAIQFTLSPEAKSAASSMGEKIRAEDGEKKGVESFHRHLPLKAMRCDLQPERAAAWWSPDLFLRLSSPAAVVLQDAKRIKMDSLEPIRAKEYQARWRSSDALSEGTSGLLLALTNLEAIGSGKDGKGMRTIATVMPQGVVDVLSGFHTGVDSIPARLGSATRERGRVDGLVSGIREAGKGLVYGYWDGITGLVTEPIAGGQQEGAVGVLKGMGRSYVNVWARPMAGITGAMALPIQGAYQSIRRKITGVPQQLMREARASLSQHEATSLSAEEREDIIEKFETAQQSTAKRRGYYKRKAEIFLMNMKKEQQASGEDHGEDEGYTLKGGDDVGYIQEGELRKMSKVEREEMEQMEREGYERAKAEMADGEK